MTLLSLDFQVVAWLHQDKISSFADATITDPETVAAIQEANRQASKATLVAALIMIIFATKGSDGKGYFKTDSCVVPFKDSEGRDAAIGNIGTTVGRLEFGKFSLGSVTAKVISVAQYDSSQCLHCIQTNDLLCDFITQDTDDKGEDVNVTEEQVGYPTDNCGNDSTPVVCLGRNCPISIDRDPNIHNMKICE